MKTLKNQFASRCELDVNRCELVNSSTGLGSGRGTIDPITVAEILMNAGIDPVRPQDATLTNDEPTSEQSTQDAADALQATLSPPMLKLPLKGSKPVLPNIIHVSFRRVSASQRIFFRRPER